MIKKIMIDNNYLHFSKADLPLLIHGNDGHGASLFSVSVMADLFSQGNNVVFLCGHHMARDEFELQTQSIQDSVAVNEDFKSTEIEGKQVIFIPSEQPELLKRVLQLLTDTNERVIFLKNFDLFDVSVFSAVENMPNIVMMGDVDKCTYAKRLLNKDWTSRIFFSASNTDVQVKIPELEKYKGFMKSNSKEGFVSLVQ